MAPVLFSIPLDAPGRLAITARPRGNDWLPDEVAAWKRAGVTLAVSLLTPDEETDLGLVNEATECAAAGVQFLRVPVPDRGIPANRTEFAGVVSAVVAELNSGGMTAVHCRQSVGRAPLLAIAVLKAFGATTADATTRMSVVRGVQVPETKEQAEWVDGLGPRTSPPLHEWRGGVQSAKLVGLRHELCERVTFSARTARGENNRNVCPLNTPSP